MWKWRILVHTAPACGTLSRSEWRSVLFVTELNCAKITALMYEQKPCPVWLTVRYSVNKGEKKIAKLKNLICNASVNPTCAQPPPPPLPPG